MRSHLITATIITLALFWSGSLLLAGNATNYPLWGNAVAVAEVNADWVPGLIITRSEVLHKGKVVAVHEMWQRSKPGTKGEVVTETVKVLEDGKDVTKAEQKKNKEKSGRNKTDAKGGGNPFDATLQDRLSLSAMDGSRTIGGRECAGYAFELRNKNRPVARGTAWLDKETGTPCGIDDMTLDPLPDKHLRSLSITTGYEISTNGAWLQKTMTTASKMSVMLLKVETRTTTTFSEHWKKPHLLSAPGGDRD